MATVSLGSGSRLRSLWAFRIELVAEHTPRMESMVVTKSLSAGKSSAAGKSARCTERSPVRPRQMTSDSIGSRGAVTRVRASSTV